MPSPARQPRARTSAATLLLLLAWLPVDQLQAQFATPGVFISRSYSGQFIVQSAPPSFGSAMVSFLENDTNYVRLDPTLLTVSCERIKQILWRELEVASPWNGKIFLRLYPINSADDPILIDSEHFQDGWQYRVALPNLIQREKFLRSMVRVVLLELANRNATAHSAEIPVWLTEGLSRQLLESDQREVILPPPQMSDAGLRITTLMVNARRERPLELARKELSAATPLSFQQLSWPVPDPLTGEPTELFRSSAQLFVHQLLASPDGPACLRNLLSELPGYYNWQFAFFHAFRESFTQPLEVEKWWSLQLLHFTGRELTENWPPEESWQKLDELVRSTVQIRVGTNELPLQAEITLQTIIRDWESTRQTRALETKLTELQMLRPRLTQELAVLVDSYCTTIETYLQNLNHKSFILPFRRQALRQRNVEQTLKLLDELDTRRAGLRPPEKPTPQIQADSQPTSLGQR